MPREMLFETTVRDCASGSAVGQEMGAQETAIAANRGHVTPPMAT